MRDVLYLLHRAVAIFVCCLIAETMLKLLNRAVVVLTLADILAIHQ